MDVTDKQLIYEECCKMVEDKVLAFKNLIADARASNNDTKSSMGDKYETSREMLQQEINMLEKQLSETVQLQQTLQKIKIIPSLNVALGALVRSEQGNFFIAASIGELKVKEQKIMALSVNSPLIKAMMGKKEGESFTFNNKTYHINQLI